MQKRHRVRFKLPGRDDGWEYGQVVRIGDLPQGPSVQAGRISAVPPPILFAVGLPVEKPAIQRVGKPALRRYWQDAPVQADNLPALVTDNINRHQRNP